jgi:hypothetical protein
LGTIDFNVCPLLSCVDLKLLESYPAIATYSICRFDMTKFRKILKPTIVFCLTLLICISGYKIPALAKNNIFTNGQNSTYPYDDSRSIIAAKPSGECEEIGDDDEKKDLLAKKLVRYMKSKNYNVSSGKEQYNIVYIEGACADGTPNADEFDVYNDRRIIFKFVDGDPKIIGNWLATTEPGEYYTNNPPLGRSVGVARISFGQYPNSYKIGPHTGPGGDRYTHEGQLEIGKVTITRDINRDGMRTGDPVSTGNYGLNQHRGNNKSDKKIGRDSAGCLVGWSREGHTEFMDIIKRDTRYINNSGYKFTTTILNGDWFGAAT